MPQNYIHAIVHISTLFYQSLMIIQEETDEKIAKVILTPSIKRYMWKNMFNKWDLNLHFWSGILSVF